LTKAKVKCTLDAPALILAGVIALAALLCFVRVSLADNPPLAKGDGFVITGDDVALLKAKYPSPTEVDEKIYTTRALMLRLFAKEAAGMGLGGKQGKGEGKDALTLDKQEELSNLLIEKLLKESPVDDLVIESFYRANPDRFQKDLVKDGEEGLRPLDEGLKTEIREMVLGWKKNKIVARAFERLKDKYNADFCDEGDGAGK